MLRYDALTRHPRALRRRTGFDQAGFEGRFAGYDAAAVAAAS